MGQGCGVERGSMMWGVDAVGKSHHRQEVYMHYVFICRVALSRAGMRGEEGVDAMGDRRGFPPEN